eukprot:748821-Hanusia_phi.AAC.1
METNQQDTEAAEENKIVFKESALSLNSYPTSKAACSLNCLCTYISDQLALRAQVRRSCFAYDFASTFQNYDLGCC